MSVLLKALLLATLATVITQVQGGTTYVRWGRTTCPTEVGTQVLYSGRAGSTNHGETGGGADFLCMPDDPDTDYLGHYNGVQNFVDVAGVEYFAPPTTNVNGHNAPCAVCYVPTRSTSVMIPAKRQCPSGWVAEYVGYLMAQHRIQRSRSTFVCVDHEPESVPGLNGYADPRAILYPVEPACGGLSCSQYKAERELICTVCTR